MENLKQQERTINLGKLLVKELGLDDSVDTLGRWMAHYLAELIATAGKAKGKKKQETEIKCFETILKLWAHRRMLPSGKQPLENFEPIFELISKLDPDRDKPFYILFTGQEEQKEKGLDFAGASSVKDWLTVAEEIDKVARTWISYVLQKAAEGANTKTTAKYLENAIVLPEDIDMKVITLLLDSDIPVENAKGRNAKIIKTDKEKKIRKRIEQLQNFNKLNRMLLKASKEELDRIKK